jgi:hypothetical protein
MMDNPNLQIEGGSVDTRQQERFNGPKLYFMNSVTCAWALSSDHGAAGVSPISGPIGQRG